MNLAHIGVGVLLFLFGQSTRPAFEVASIRASVDAQRQAVAAVGRIDGAQYRIAGLTLKDYVSMAYGLKLNQITGPDWIATDRFDIWATLPEGAKPNQIPAMMQTLLEDRFELKSHRDKKEFPVYALRVASGGLKVSEVPADPASDPASATTPQTYTRSGSGQGISVDYGLGSSFAFVNDKFEGKKLTMTLLASTLERFLDRPVLDATTLTGAYDVSFDLAPEDYRMMLIRAAVAAGLVMSPNALRALDGPSSPPSLVDGLGKFGLQLESRRAPLEVLIVDSARKTPSEN
jgi:uncharacterized protein (TIGR03435 family)